MSNKTNVSFEVDLTDDELRSVKICCSSREWQEGIIPMFAKLRAKNLDKLEDGSENDDKIRGELARLRKLMNLSDLVRKC